MTNWRVAAILCEVGFVLCLVSMILGPFDIVSESIAAGVAASVLALCGIYFALCSWHEPEPDIQPELTPDIPEEEYQFIKIEDVSK